MANFTRSRLSRVSRGLSLIAVVGALVIGTQSRSAGSSQSDASTAVQSNTRALSIEEIIDIPGVPVGPYSDTMAVDPAGNRLFATPQAAKAVAVLDLIRGRVLKMITGIGNPHAIAYNDKTKRLFVADGASGDVKVFDGSDYSLIKTIPLKLGTDMGAYDTRRQIFYVMNGGQKAGMTHSVISVIDTVSMKKWDDLTVDTIDPQGLEVDPINQLLYVALPDKFAVTVIDLRTKQVRATFKMPEGKMSPWITAVDPVRPRVYVACRDDIEGSGMRGSMVVIDTTTGHAVASFPIGGWADSIFVDQKRQRIYVSTGLGKVETFEIGSGDTFHRLPPIETALLAKTSLYSSELDRLFVTSPNLGLRDAGVIVLRPLP